MPALDHPSFERVSFAYDGRAPLIDALTLTLSAPWTGVVGPNGAGKSTLLRLLSGALRPSAGVVRARSAWLCPQRVEALTPEIEAFAWAWGGAACRWRDRLRLHPEDLERWPTLSPGERKRWQIGAAVAEDPALLLLDEPTNHLDVEARAALVDALRAYRGRGVVVSHDRALLDGLTDATLWLEGGAATLTPLPFTPAEAERARGEDAALAELERASAARRCRRRQLQVSRERLQAANSQTTRSRVKGPKDSDARSVAAKGRAAKGQARQARAVGLARAQLERSEAHLEHLGRPEALGRGVFLQYDAPRRATLLELRTAALRVGGRPLLRDLDLQLRRGEKVRLTGPNGAGKSTLIRALLSRCALPPERLLFVPQQLTEADGVALRARALALPPEARGRVMQCVAALGLRPAQLLDTPRPSPGEARKLAIALGLGQHAWLAVLDEPEDHLDLPSRQRLQEALVAFPGALLLVSHDDRLAEACADRRWDIEDSYVRVGGAGPGGRSSSQPSAR